MARGRSSPLLPGLFPLPRLALALPSREPARKVGGWSVSHHRGRGRAQRPAAVWLRGYSRQHVLGRRAGGQPSCNDPMICGCVACVVRGLSVSACVPTTCPV
jgi:hypothetical protein